jgi:SAM-dependent methyltransferase
LKLYFIQNIADYQGLIESESQQIDSHIEYINKKTSNTKRKFYVKGYSNVSHSVVNFICNFQNSSELSYNWRENLICPNSGFNNRMRFSIHLIKSLLNLNSNSSIYIMEQVTPLYKYLLQSYPNLIGSEYLENSIPLGAVDASGIRNEDATALTFQDNSFDAILSFEVLEHISNFKLALTECFRTLKKGGRLLASVPFILENQKNQIQAMINNDGKIIHILEAKYHGNSYNKQSPSLVYQTFGWEFLDNLREAGFSDVYAILGWSNEYCYFRPQVQFIAVK